MNKCSQLQGVDVLYKIKFLKSIFSKTYIPGNIVMVDFKYEPNPIINVNHTSQEKFYQLSI